MKRVFISFAMEDNFARNNLAYQAQQNHTPFDFVDMSVREPWSSAWKTNCRERIKSCDGMIALISDNTPTADGARWEIKCAYEEGVKVLPVYIHDHGVQRSTPELAGKAIHHWTWPTITKFVDSL